MLVIGFIAITAGAAIGFKLVGSTLLLRQWLQSLAIGALGAGIIFVAEQTFPPAYYYRLLILLTASALTLVTDIKKQEVHLIPTAVAVVGLLVDSVVVSAVSLAQSLIGGAVCAAASLLLHAPELLRRSGPAGWGDVLYNILTGLALGWIGGLIAVALGGMFAGVVAFAHYLVHRQKDAIIPCIPALFAGVIVTILLCPIWTQ